MRDVPSLERQRQMAEATFPDKWKATLSMPGEKRRRAQKALRGAAIYEAAMIPLRQQGASCVSCKHWSRFDSTRMQCDIDSDLYGSRITTGDFLCPSWKSRR